MRLSEKAVISHGCYFKVTTLDDTDYIGDIAQDAGNAAELTLQVVQRPLRPPTMTERLHVIGHVGPRNRQGLWEILSRGLSLPSTIPIGDTRINPLVTAIESNWQDEHEDSAYPNSVLALLYARVDPNNVGAPPVSPLGQAVRFHDDRAVEQLLEHGADTEYREPGRELPLLHAVRTGTARCVSLLLRYRANPLATELLPVTHDSSGRGTRVRYRTAAEVAVPHSEIAALLEQAISHITLQP